jgi:hypothetical protein
MTGTEILNKSRTQSKGHSLLLQGEFFGHLSGKIRCAGEIFSLGKNTEYR